jgi:hypothetical protein
VDDHSQGNKQGPDQKLNQKRQTTGTFRGAPIDAALKLSRRPSDVLITSDELGG